VQDFPSFPGKQTAGQQSRSVLGGPRRGMLRSFFRKSNSSALHSHNRISEFVVVSNLWRARVSVKQGFSRLRRPRPEFQPNRAGAWRPPWHMLFRFQSTGARPAPGLRIPAGPTRLRVRRARRSRLAVLPPTSGSSRRTPRRKDFHRNRRLSFLRNRRPTGTAAAVCPARMNPTTALNLAPVSCPVLTGGRPATTWLRSNTDAQKRCSQAIPAPSLPGRTASLCDPVPGEKKKSQVGPAPVGKIVTVAMTGRP